MVQTQQLRDIVGVEWVVTDRERMQQYLTDETVAAVRPRVADHVAVVKPATAEEVSAILRLANRENTPVFPRGAGTSPVAGSLPTSDGIVLSLERFDKVEEVDTQNLMAVVQAGVTLGQLIEAVESVGLSFPPHPGDEGAQIGGLVACNAGGVRAVKYGVVRNFVKGLTVVMANGHVIKMGGKLLKNNTGLDLMQLLIGSEGILGVITQVVLRLYPRFEGAATLVVTFGDRHAAVQAVPKILQAGIIPLAIEYADQDLLVRTAEYLSTEWPAKKGSAQLVIMLTGATQEEVYAQCEQTSNVCEAHGALDVLIAERREEQAEILRVRSEIWSMLKPRLADVLDVAVPPASIADFMEGVDRIAERFETRIPMYGHAADGNLHPHLLEDLCQRDLLEKVKQEIYAEMARMGGAVTAEHGIGKARTDDFGRWVDEPLKELMRGVKNVFDPNGILNPGSGVV